MNNLQLGFDPEKLASLQAGLDKLPPHNHKAHFLGHVANYWLDQLGSIYTRLQSPSHLPEPLADIDCPPRAPQDPESGVIEIHQVSTNVIGSTDPTFWQRKGIS